MLNTIGEKRQTWRTPTEVWKKSPLMLFWRTALLESSYSALMTSMMLMSNLKLPQAFVPYTIGCFLEVDEVMVEYMFVLQMFLYQLSYVEDLF